MQNYSEANFISLQGVQVYQLLDDVEIERSIIKTKWEDSKTIVFFEINKP